MAASVPSFTSEGIQTWSAAACRWVLLVLVGGLPLFFLRFTNDPFEVPKLALLIAGVAVAVTLRSIQSLQGAAAEGLRRLWMPAAFILVPLTLAWALSSYRYWSLFGEYKRFQGLVPYVVVVLLGALAADAFTGRLNDLAWAFVVGGGIVGAYALIQLVGADPFEWGTVSGLETTRTSTLGNPNFTGGYLAITTPVALALWREGGARSTLAFRVLIVIVAAQLVSLSQGGYAASVAAAAIFFGIVLEPRWRNARLLSSTVAALMAVLVVGVVVIAMIRPSLSILPTTIQKRALWWQGAIAMAIDHPIAGRGPNAYAVDGVRYRPVRDSVQNGLDISDDVHSVPLSLMTSAGAFGLLGFLGIFVWAWRLIARIDPGDMLRAGFAGAVVAYFVQSLVSIDQVSLRVVLWASLGALVAGGAQKIDSQTRPRPSRKARSHPVRKPIAVAIAVVVGLLPVWWATKFIHSDVRAWQGALAFRAGEPETGSVLYDGALAFRDDYSYRHFYGVYLGATAAQTDSDDERWIDEMDQAFSYLDDFPSLFGLRDYARAQSELASDYPGRAAAAADLYQRVLALDPYNFTMVAEAVPVLTAERRYERLIDLFGSKIDVLEERVPELWAHLAIAYEHLGRHEDAVHALERALALVPPGSVVVIEAQEAIDPGQ